MLALSGGKLSDGERTRDTWKELAVSGETQSSDIPSLQHLPTGGTGGVGGARYPAPVLFPAPLSPTPHLALFSRGPLKALFSGYPDLLPPANCFPQPNPIFHLPQISLLRQPTPPPKKISSFSSLPLRSFLAPSLDPPALALSEPLSPPPAPLL